MDVNRTVAGTVLRKMSKLKAHTVKMLKLRISGERE